MTERDSDPSRQIPPFRAVARRPRSFWRGQTIQTELFPLPVALAVDRHGSASAIRDRRRYAGQQEELEQQYGWRAADFDAIDCCKAQAQHFPHLC